MDVAINSDYLLMHLVLIGLLTDTFYVLRELNLCLFHDNFDTKFSLITELLFLSSIVQQHNSHLLPKTLLCLQLTFSVRTSRHSLGTSRWVNFVVLNNYNNKVIIIN